MDRQLEYVMRRLCEKIVEARNECRMYANGGSAFAECFLGKDAVAMAYLDALLLCASSSGASAAIRVYIMIDVMDGEQSGLEVADHVVRLEG